MSAPPAWIKDGVRVIYQSSPGPKYAYIGTVEGKPCLVGGGTWVVRLRAMEPRYRDGARSTVPAAACDSLRPFDEDPCSRCLCPRNAESRTRNAESRILAEEERTKLTGDALHAEGLLDEASKVLGQVVVAGTLRPGERLVGPSDHAAVQAILGVIAQRESLIVVAKAAREYLMRSVPDPNCISAEDTLREALADLAMTSLLDEEPS